MSAALPGPDFELHSTAQDGRCVLSVAGELDVATAPRLEAVLGERLAEGPVVLDLGRVTFMDSSGVVVLDRVLAELARRGWSLAVRPEVQDAVRRVLELTRLWEALPIERGAGSNGPAAPA